MRVLVACEFSGVVREAFRAAGHDAHSCDLLPTETYSRYHHQEDIFALLKRDSRWDLLITHWPCTNMCNSGVRWLYNSDGTKNVKRWKAMRRDARAFKKLLDMPIRCIAAENPIMHRYARKIVGRGPDQIVQPWWFGHGETKATGLWLKNLPKLEPTHRVSGRVPRVHYASPGPDRWKERSRTLQGLAEAMVKFWGNCDQVWV